MPSQALSRQSALAGQPIPARHGTLQYFLTLALQPGSTKAELIAAVELDPGLLLPVLGAVPTPSPLGRWHEYIGEHILRAMAVTLGNVATAPASMPEAAESGWRSSVAQGFIAANLASGIDNTATDDARLAGLLSSIGEGLPGDAAAQAAAAADYLASLGCEARICDAIRYQHESLSAIAGTTTLLRVNAVARNLAAWIDDVGALPASLLDKATALLAIGEDQVYGALGRASRSIEDVAARLTELASNFSGEDAADSKADCVAALVQSANVSAVFYRALQKSAADADFDVLVGQAGSYLFGFQHVVHLRPEQDLLVGELDGEAISVTIEATNSFAKAYAGGDVTIVAEALAVHVLEKQLMQRLSATHLLLLPLGDDAGLLACATNESMAADVAHHRPLLLGFADAAADLYRQGDNDPQVDSISLDALGKRVREITHEVNNPLAIVQNYLRTLSLKLGDDSPYQKDIENISREAMRVGTIVQKYAGIGAEEKLALRRVDLNELVTGLLDSVMGGHENIEVVKRFDASVPSLELAADAISQVLVNLLKNAVEALMETPSPCVVVSTQGAVNLGGRHFIEVTVTDNGPGMSNEQRLSLFTPGTSSKGEGRGLGLGIARQLMNEMGGMISCRDNNLTPDSSGTSFQVLIPLEQ